MHSDQIKPPVPAGRDLAETHIRPETDAQAVLGFLPKTGTVGAEEKIAVAREEGYDPMAVTLAWNPPTATTAEKIRLLVLTLVAAILVILLFPLDRFFKPSPRDLGSMTIGGPTLEEALTPAEMRDKPWLKVLVAIDRLYFREGKLTDAIRLAESELEKVPQKSRADWKHVYYRYWELLSDAGRLHVLKTSTRSFLTAFPEDPFGGYYHARAFLAAADPIRTFSRKEKAAYREEAESIIRQTDRTCRTLRAQSKHPDAREATAALTDLYQKLRLEQARLFVFIWKLGGYQEDTHPDVAYRDKALDICDSEELSGMKEAKKLKVTIYTHILDRWNWFEGQQIIQGRKHKRKDFQQELETLTGELKKTETL